MHFIYHFFSRGIRMHILFITGIQNGRISPQNNIFYYTNVPFKLKFQDEIDKMDAKVAKKTHIFCYKIFFLKLLFRDEGHLYAN